MNETTSRVSGTLTSIVRLERDAMRDFWSCFWRDMNIIGKLVFLPVLLFGTVILPVIIPLVAGVVLICTWKPNTHGQVCGPAEMTKS